MIEETREILVVVSVQDGGGARIDDQVSMPSHAICENSWTRLQGSQAMTDARWPLSKFT